MMKFYTTRLFNTIRFLASERRRAEKNDRFGNLNDPDRTSIESKSQFTRRIRFYALRPLGLGKLARLEVLAAQCATATGLAFAVIEGDFSCT